MPGIFRKKIDIHIWETEYVLQKTYDQNISLMLYKIIMKCMVSKAHK